MDVGWGSACIPPRARSKRKCRQLRLRLYVRRRALDNSKSGNGILKLNDSIAPAELAKLIGHDLGTSDWFLIDQRRIDGFADVTEDHQFIHVDLERAKQTPFGGTIAHGLLTLSMIVHLCLDFVPRLQGTTMVLNYGFNRVRFPAPVKEGARVRARVKLADVEQRGGGQYVLTIDVVMEIENEKKPALIAEWLSFHIVGDAP
jgi:acyl dehydratase